MADLQTRSPAQSTSHPYLPPRRTRARRERSGVFLIVSLLLVAVSGLGYFRYAGMEPGRLWPILPRIVSPDGGPPGEHASGGPEPKVFPPVTPPAPRFFEALGRRPWTVVPAAALEGAAPQDLAAFEGLLALEKRSNPVEVRGIYVPAGAAGQKPWFENLVQLVETTELNAMVIDVKNDSGVATYNTGLRQLEAIGAEYRLIGDLPGMVAELNRRGIYTIARLVVFKDSVLATARPELAVRTMAGGVWRDRKGIAWANPYLREVWDYNLAVAEEAAAMGFREIQFDYVRFPSDGNTHDAVYAGAEGRTPAEAIGAFLDYARRRLAAKGVFVSADVFGQVPSIQDDMGIGQHWESLVGNVDYLSPMAYPSHYAPRVYGLPDPDGAPYATVLGTLKDALARTREGEAMIRPWLQSFSLRHRYGPEEVRAQIRAVYDAGLKEWLLWNPGAVYMPGSLNK